MESGGARSDRGAALRVTKFSNFELIFSIVSEEICFLRDHDRREFSGFFEECFDLCRRQQFTLRQDFQPKRTFVGLFFHDRQFGDHIGGGFSPAGRPIVGPDRSSRAPKLIRNDSSRSGFGECFDLIKDSKRETLRADFHFIFVHGWNGKRNEKITDFGLCLPPKQSKMEIRNTKIPSASSNFGSLKTDLDAKNFFHTAGDEAGLQIKLLRHLDPVDVQHGVIATL